jgi:hypothetical protein
VHKHTNVSLRHDIQFSFLSVLSSLLDLGHARGTSMQGLEIIEIGHFCLDEASFKVGVNHSCCLWRQRALLNRPCTNFLGPARVKGLQAKSGTTGTNDAGNNRFDICVGALESEGNSFLTAFFEVSYMDAFIVCWVLVECTIMPAKQLSISGRRTHTIHSFGIILHVKQLLLKFTAHRNNLSTSMFLDPCCNLGQPLATFANKVLFCHVDDIDLRFGSNETPILDELHFSLREFSRLHRSRTFDQLFALFKG